VEKYTLFMVRGTGGRTVQNFFGGSSNLAGNVENMVGKLLEPAVWNTVDIVYPGDQVSVQSFLNMSTTVERGVTGLASRIRELAPGQKFALCGYSQGAIVVSKIYDMIRSGELGRDEDLLAGIGFGNPRRAEGWSIPGGTEPANSRGALFTDLMETPDERWWDFVTSGDQVADCRYTTNEGRARELVFQSMYGNYSGQGSFADEIAEQFSGGLFAGLSLGLEDIQDAAAVMFEAIVMGLQIPFWNNETLNSSPHLQYHLRYENLPGNKRSAVELAANYLNSIARPITTAKPQASQFTSNIGKALPVIGAGGKAPDPRSAPIAAYRYLDAKRDLIDIEARERPLIRLWDNQHKYVGTLASEQSLNAEELLHDTGQCDIVVRADDWLIDFMRRDVRKDEDLHITIDPYPHRRNWRWRYGAKVTNVRVKRAEDGLRTVTLECSHNREHWKHLLFGATPFCDPAVQPLRAWLLPGNTRTVIATTAFINLARNFWPILALPAQALNPGAWTGQASRLANLNPLNWPVQVQFVNPIFDQSRFSVIMSRWSDAHSVTEGMLRDAGCHVRAYTWLPEDEDSPHPELAALVGQANARPTRACVVLAVADASGVSGPTGTAIDGAINFIAATGDSLVTENLIPVDADGDGVTDPLIRRLVGVAPELPAIAFRDTERSSIVSSEHSMFRAKAQKIFTGGKSPGWVNQLQTFAIKYALSQISYAIQTLAGPELTAVETPGSPGLEEIYQGQFDNMLLAYISITDPVRSSRSGPYGYLEHFEQGSGSAYTISSTLTLREGHYKTRPYQGFKVAIRNGGQHTLYYDIDLGTRCHFEIDGIFHTDQVTAIKLHYDLTTAKTFELAIGDDRESENPMAAATRAIANIWNAVGMLFGSGDLF
jgi:hypothetical protein